MKQRINITLDKDIIRQIFLFAKRSKRSVSSIIESQLRKIISASKVVDKNLNTFSDDHDWLDTFHEKHLKKGFKEPTDSDLQKMRTKHFSDKYK